MAHMTTEQLALLEKLVDGYWSNSEGEAKEDFYFGASMGQGPTIEHRSLEEEALEVGDLEELAALGLVSVNWENDLSGRVRPTAEGKHVIEEQRRIADIAKADRAISGGGPGIGWEATLPVLEAIVRLYDEADAGEDISQMQVSQKLGRDDGDSGVSRAFEVLQRNRYVEGRTEIDGLPGPLTVAPTEKALQLLAGWPTSGEAALQKLLSILDTRIEAAPDEERKGKLRALRNSLVDIGEGVAAEVLVKLMTA